MYCCVYLCLGVCVCQCAYVSGFLSIFICRIVSQGFKRLANKPANCWQLFVHSSFLPSSARKSPLTKRTNCVNHRPPDELINCLVKATYCSFLWLLK